MAFARALNENDPRWYDEESEAAREHGGVVAPPTFVNAAAHYDPDWPYRPRADRPWHGSGADYGRPSPTAPGGGTSVHAEQHYEYFVPVRAGDVLWVERASGRSWEKQGRSGTLRFEEQITRFTNQRGELAVVATQVRAVTGGSG